MTRLLLACLLVVSLAVPALADNPAMGPYGPPKIQSSLYLTGGQPSLLADFTIHATSWERNMRRAGICYLTFLGDGSGVRLRIANEGKDCGDSRDGPVISFPEFRRRMEAP